MLSTFLILAVGLFLCEFVGYFIHRALHSPKTGVLYQKHMTHHLKLYPVTDFYSQKYRSPGKDSTIITFAIFFAAFAGLMLLILPLKFGIIWGTELLIFGFLNDYLHDVFHIKPNWLEKRKWFQRLRDVHFIHHQDMSKNYGIFTFLGDRIFGTLTLR